MEENYIPDENTGLTSEQAQERKSAGQINVCDSHKTKTYKQIFKDNLITFFNILNLVLTVFVVFTGDYKNLTFLFVVVGNLIIGIFQEIASKKTLDKLSLIVAAKTTVIRDGKRISLNICDVVLSDIIVLKTGDQICVDGALTNGYLEVNESLVTGESDIILKKKGDTLYSGSYVVSGNGRALVTGVGDNSFANKIAGEAKASKKSPSKLSRDIGYILKSVSYVIIPIGLLMFFRQYAMGFGYNDSIAKSVASVIGMIPEGLILLTSLSLATSAIILANKKTLVQSLYSIETMARTDTLCLDKTGTITEGKLFLRKIIDLESADTHELLSYFCGAIKDDNATVSALRDYIGNKIVHKNPDMEIPFSSERKFSGVYIEETGFIAFGAYEFLFKDKDEIITEKIRDFSEKGNRVLAVAVSKHRPNENELPEDLSCIGLAVFADKIRSDAASTLEYFYAQGVDIKIISGDNPLTVKRIAEKAGLKDVKCIDATELDTMEKIKEAVSLYNVFGRVSPNQKKQMIAAIKRSGKTVAMMGDGVNDVPALKEADCSIAVASGSDAAKSIANLVLLDSNFASVPNVVSEGRKVVNNIQRAATLFITKTIYSLLLAVFTLLLPQMSYPFTPVQMVLISFVTIGFPAFFLSFEFNTSKIKGNFLLDVFAKSLPGGVCAVGSMIVLNYIANSFQIPHNMISTMCIVLASAAGIWVTAKVCYPFTLSRKIILASTIGIFALCLSALSWYFDIVPLNTTCIIILLISIASMPFVMYVLETAVKKSFAGIYKNIKKLKNKFRQKILN
jgi:cation-transporting ATPase E